MKLEFYPLHWTWPRRYYVAAARPYMGYDFGPFTLKRFAD